jgi:hypothetical protein
MNFGMRYNPYELANDRRPLGNGQHCTKDTTMALYLYLLFVFDRLDRRQPTPSPIMAAKYALMNDMTMKYILSLTWPSLLGLCSL